MINAYVLYCCVVAILTSVVDGQGVDGPHLLGAEIHLMDNSVKLELVEGPDERGSVFFHQMIEISESKDTNYKQDALYIESDVPVNVLQYRPDPFPETRIIPYNQTAVYLRKFCQDIEVQRSFQPFGDVEVKRGVPPRLKIVVDHVGRRDLAPLPPGDYHSKKYFYSRACRRRVGRGNPRNLRGSSISEKYTYETGVRTSTTLSSLIYKKLNRSDDFTSNFYGEADHNENERRTQYRPPHGQGNRHNPKHKQGNNTPHRQGINQKPPIQGNRQNQKANSGTSGRNEPKRPYRDKTGSVKGTENNAANIAAKIGEESDPLPRVPRQGDYRAYLRDSELGCTVTAEVFLDGCDRALEISAPSVNVYAGLEHGPSTTTMPAKTDKYQCFYKKFGFFDTPRLPAVSRANGGSPRIYVDALDPNTCYT